MFPDGVDLAEQRVPEWTLGDRMRKALQLEDLSVGEMAERLGVTRATVGRWLNDGYEPSIAVIRKWAAICGVSLIWLIEGDDAVRDAVARLKGFEPPTF